MKNYLLYFLAIIIWIAALPLAGTLADSEKKPDYTPPESLRVQVGGEVKEMKIDEYVLGALYNEISPDYNRQALLAQAVAVRSLTLFLLDNPEAFPEEKPEGVDIPQNSAYFPPYQTYEQLKIKLGDEKALTFFELAGMAVYATAGTIVTWKNRPALTLYHASSHGRTEKFANLYDTSLSYLESVSTPDEQSFLHYKKEVDITFAELEALCNQNRIVYTHKEGEELLLRQNDTGRMETITFGSTVITAAVFARMLGLPSLQITVTVKQEGYRVESLGFGSGLGMSQYGAHLLAEGGYDYIQILQYYYPGIEILTK